VIKKICFSLKNVDGIRTRKINTSIGKMQRYTVDDIFPNIEMTTFKVMQVKVEGKRST